MVVDSYGIGSTYLVAEDDGASYISKLCGYLSRNVPQLFARRTPSGV
jgi:hypothetical protein